MDEPLSNLDAKMRVQTRTDIAKLQADLGVTTVYVTHDQVEAMTMGDRVAVMKDGYLQQVDTPLNLYDRPANLFVAGFIGSPADEPARAPPRSTARPRSATTWCRSTRPPAQKMKGDIIVGVRPEAWRIVGRRGGRAAGRGHRRRGARRGRVRLRHQRRGGHARQRDRPGRRPRHGAQGRHDLRHHRPPQRARVRRRYRRTPQRLTGRSGGQRVARATTQRPKPEAGREPVCSCASSPPSPTRRW